MVSTTKALRVGLIGCGRIVRKHRQSVLDHPDLTFEAACDVVFERAEAAVQGTSARAYNSIEAMFAAEQLDVAAVLTESGAHFECGLAAAPHVKALVVEKPMTLSLAHADQLIEACDAHGTRLFVVKQNRFNPPIVRLRKALDAGRFGKLVMATVRVRWCRPQAYYDLAPWRGTWRWDGGVLTNQASHHIDLLQWMMGPVESVMAYTSRQLVDIEAEDTGVAILRFTSGALGVVEATTATRPKDLEGSLSILGERASVVIGGFAVNEVKTWNFSEPLPEDADVFDASTAPPSIYGFGHTAFYDHMVDCLHTGRGAMLDGLEGRKSLELINAIYESAGTGREVRLHYVPRSVPLGLP